MAKFVTLIGLIASLNLALFVFNHPAAPLDGGHVAGAFWEGLKRETARLLGRPDPGYVDVAACRWRMPCPRFSCVMSVLLIYAEIVKLHPPRRPTPTWFEGARGPGRRVDHDPADSALVLLGILPP